MNKRASGFTIVELLIVIVVIAILAAITIVAYNGIQNRANDSAVQSDLARDVKSIELYRVDNGNYPASYTNLVAMKIAGYPLVASQQAYSTVSPTNYGVCFDTTDDTYAVAARSKSGKVWYVSSKQKSPTEYPTTWQSGVAALCQNIIDNYSNGQWVYQASTWSTAIL